jgi:molybdopterin molybdotransferase
VIPVEETDFQYRDPGIPAPLFVKIHRSVKTGDYVRPRGQDVQDGDVILQQYKIISPQDLGMLAAVGKADVLVFCQPCVGLLSTGDELLTVDQPIHPGKIYDSNSIVLGALVEQYGGVPIHLGISKDRIEDVRMHLDQAIENEVDLIISSAGVSVGAFDFVKTVIEENGEVKFWRVNMRPGKPLMFGRYKNIPIIGLPGNPVSAFVGFEVFIRPAIWKLAGFKKQPRTKYKVRILHDIDSDGRESYLRAITRKSGEEWVAELTGHQGSGNLRSLVQANALVIIPSGAKNITAGTELDAWFLENMNN